MPYAHEGTLSVLDPRRPENCRRNTRDNVSYIYAPRVPKVSFSLGWELEANHKPTRYPDGVELISDGSVNGDSAEFIVLPSLVKSARFVLGLLKDLVHAPELNTDKSCGFHVHFAPRGVSVEKMRKWAINCEVLALRVESLAFEAVPDARKANSYCRKIVPISHGTRFQSSKYGNDRRYHWVNTVEMFRPGGIRTVEVRLLGNTHRWKYLLSWSLFCLALGKEAWKLIYQPLAVEESVIALSDYLKKIRDEIKPLDKRGDPIPQWVYESLTRNFGIDSTKWERPLATLVAKESEVQERRRPFYSDNQATIEENESSDYSCPCGCGSDERCGRQAHDDGDCSHNECISCCENGDCGGSPDCQYCLDNRHSNNEYCDNVRCRRCEQRGLIPQELPLDDAPVTATESRDAIETFRGASLERIVIDETANVGTGTYAGIVHPSNVPSLVASAIDNPDNYAPTDSRTASLETLQTLTNALRAQSTDAVNLAIVRAYMCGTGIDEVLTAGQILRRTSPISEGVEIPISEDELTQSRDRETFYNNGGAR